MFVNQIEEYKKIFEFQRNVIFIPKLKKLSVIPEP